MSVLMENPLSVLIAIAIMAGTTYLLRMLPLTIFRKKIRSPFFRSFLSYVPYAVLAAMTIPDIFFVTSFILSAVIGLLVALLLSYRGYSLLTVAIGAVISVYLSERLLEMLPWAF